MGTDENGNDGKYSQEALRAFFVSILDCEKVGGSGKFIESISQSAGIIDVKTKDFGQVARGSAVPATGEAIYLYLQSAFSHNIMRLIPKNITFFCQIFFLTTSLDIYLHPLPRPQCTPFPPAIPACIQAPGQRPDRASANAP